MSPRLGNFQPCLPVSTSSQVDGVCVIWKQVASSRRAEDHLGLMAQAGALGALPVLMVHDARLARGPLHEAIATANGCPLCKPFLSLQKLNFIEMTTMRGLPLG